MLEKKNIIILVFVALLFSGYTVLFSQERNVKAFRINSEIIIDGRLSEPEWQRADVAKDFIQRDPKEGAPETEKTEIRILCDDDYIYFGCIMYDSQPDKIINRLARRDNKIESDNISIRIDSHHDHLTCYEFTLLVSGTQVDIMQYNNGKNEDISWNAVWESKTQVTDFGWVAEIKIPFRELRFNTGSRDSIWGINFVRELCRNHEYAMWKLIPKNQSGQISNFGHLVGLDALKEPVRLDILPYVASSIRSKPVESQYEKYNKFSFNSGVDIKYGLSSSYTLDVAVNPDFGQVESDPENLNLTTFETFYSEKRPFFIEGTQILKFSTFGSDAGLFYSRRIGRKPSMELNLEESEKIVSSPENSTILMAAKVTGKNSSGFSFGALNAVTQDEYAKVISLLDGIESKRLVGPMSNYSVVRFKQDFMTNSSFGAVATSVIRKKGLPAFTGGLDWQIRTEDNLFLIDGFFATSSTFARATTDEKLLGNAGRVKVEKISGDHWLYSISGDFTSKGYNINDIGYYQSPNDIGSDIDLTYKDEVPNLWYRYIFIESHYGLRDNFDKVNLYKNASLSTEYGFLNYWAMVLGASYSFGKYDDRETRGNGLYKKQESIKYSLSFNSNKNKNVVFTFSGSYTKGNRGYELYSVSPVILLKPKPNIDLKLGLRYAAYNNFEGFVVNLDDPLATSGKKTIFADRNTRENDFNLTGSIAFTTNFTFEVYSQLFFANGHYKKFKELVTPETFIDYDYNTNPDFNINSFLLNAVLRWEYLPGSTIYLVWSQARDHHNKIYDMSLGNNLDNIFLAQPDNVISLKASYLFNI
jgi:hypothetical protein